MSFFLDPAVVAIAVPLYKEGASFRANKLPLLGAVLAGAFVGIITASGTALILGT